MSIRFSVRSIVCLLPSIAIGAVAHAQAADEAPTELVVIISGFGSDASPQQLANTSPRGRGNSGMYQLAGDLTKAGLETRFFNWNGTNAGQSSQENAPGAHGIVSFIRERASGKQMKQIVMIGHSWGGHTMIEVAEELKKDPPIEIALAIGIDPSSFSRGERARKLPSSIRSFVNYHTRNAFVWGAWKGDERVVNVDLGDPSNGFAANNGRDYAATFDINAHNAAEWDEAIHADIVKRIKNVCAMADDHSPATIDK